MTARRYGRPYALYFHRAGAGVPPSPPAWPEPRAPEGGGRELTKHWIAIERALSSIGCSHALTLNPGATTPTIEKLESHTEIQLPESARDMLLGHDGQASGPGLIYGYRYLSVTEIVANWDNWRSIDEPAMNDDCAESMSSSPQGYIKPLYTNRRWIPLAHDGGGNHIGLDFDPDVNGSPGQVIRFGRDEDEKTLLASNYGDFLDRLARDLGQARWNGKYLEWPSN